ncbi:MULTISPECIES: hypothetical protein [Pseudomonas]|uniref:DUF2214 domain-containing protein n=1 Tax=Pseudomonas taiwanensis TaxID=470150 RepID=A0ABR6V3B8_9PSED|nr:hypothetical protein [Pseudomonas taiwanensis]MBC3475003.1 hypothetical protein [Pseudomonas taiwanensis]
MNVDIFLAWWGDTTIASLVRDAWYPYVRALHVGGAGVLFGALMLFDLRILGRKKNTDVFELHDQTMGLVWCGFVVAAAGGFLLFSAQPQALWENNALRLKIILILMAGLNALTFEYIFRRGRSEKKMRLSASLSLGLWSSILTCSALIPYWSL